MRYASLFACTLHELKTTDYAEFLLASLSLLLLTQSRLHNIPLLFLLHVDLRLLRTLDLGIGERAITLMLYQHASFFAFGGSNSMASIDLASAYNGVHDFNVTAVGFLVFLSNWVGPIWWTVALSLSLPLAQDGAWGAYVQQIAVLDLFTSAASACVMLACILFRSHLFVWTVFSPKYLYGVAWTFGHHLLTNVVVGALAFWTGSNAMGPV